MAQTPTPPLKHPVAALIIARRLRRWQPVADQLQIIAVKAKVLRVMMALLK